MSNAYAAVSALLFAILAVMHLVRIIGRCSVVIGPNNIHECIVGSPCGFWPALNLGLRAISLISARLDFPLIISAQWKQFDSPRRREAACCKKAPPAGLGDRGR